MFKTSEDKNVVTFHISSEMQLVDRVVRECREYLNGFNIANDSNFIVLIRELLINAIEHGNRNVTENIVTCIVENLVETRFKITVEDQGDGFDHKALDLEMPEDPKQIRNRGYALINTVADQFEFNEKGNSVTAYITVTNETEFNISENDKWKIIKPTGDITATVADKFRLLLLELLNKGVKQFRFDLECVEDIDSVSLSVFISFAKMLMKQSEEGRLEVINTNKDILDLFQMTRMDKMFQMKMG